MLTEFKEFIAKSNVMDLTIGVIIGTAFQKIVDSLVNDLVMPVVGLMLGGSDFTNLFVLLKNSAKAAPPYETLAQAKAADAVVVDYGAFLTQFVQFVILAWVVFLMVKAVNRMWRNGA